MAGQKRVGRLEGAQKRGEEDGRRGRKGGGGDGKMSKREEGRLEDGQEMDRDTVGGAGNTGR